MTKSEIQKNRALKHRYGIDLDIYNTMIKKQNNKCALCLKLLKLDRSTHVEHDHLTGKVRGIVCSSCNNTIAKIDYNPDILRRLLLYKTVDYDTYINLNFGNPS